jgi:hypothetical protein
MILFLSDEDFNRCIVRGLRRRLPRLDIVRVQDVGLITRPDTEVLDWAANAQSHRFNARRNDDEQTRL